MTATPINVLDGGGFMRRCSSCGRLKARFASEPKGHRGIGDVCWTCWEASRRKEVERQDTKPEAAPTPQPRRPGRPNKGSLWRRGGIWYAVVTLDGKTRRVSSGSRDRAAAETLLVRLMAGEQKLGA